MASRWAVAVRGVCLVVALLVLQACGNEGEFTLPPPEDTPATPVPDDMEPPPDGGGQPPDGMEPPPDDDGQPPDGMEPPPDGDGQPPDGGSPPPDNGSPPPDGTPPPLPNPGPPGRTRTIRGLVQKGVFQQLSVKARVVDTLGQTVSSVPATVDGQTYSVSVPTGSQVILEALGIFIDEISGLPVRLRQPLTAVNVGAERHNINVLTTLIASRTIGRIVNGESLSQAAESARAELIEALRFSQAESLDLTDIAPGDDASSDNFRLALLSAAVMSLPRELPIPPTPESGATSKAQEPGEPGDMSDEWYDSNEYLKRGGEFDSKSFNNYAGMSSQELAAQSGNDPNNVGDDPWVCDIDCDFRALPPGTTGVFLVDSYAHESRGRMPITVRRIGPNDEDVGVAVVLEDIGDQAESGYGRATRDADYATRYLSLELPAGVNAATEYVGVVVDAIDENPGEQLRARILSASTAQPQIVRGVARVTILDGDPPVMTGSDASTIDFSHSCLVSVGVAQRSLEEDCLNPVPNSLVLLGDQPQVVRVVGVLQGDCLRAGECPEREVDWQVDAVLVGAGNEVALGSFLYPGDEVLMSRRTPADRPQFDLSLESPGARELITAAAGGPLAVELRLQAQPQRVVSIPLPAFQQLDGLVNFGDRVAEITGANVQLLDDPSCPSGQRLQGRVRTADGATLAEAPELFAAFVTEFSLADANVCVALSNDPLPQATVTDCGPAAPESDCAVNVQFGAWAAPPGAATRFPSRPLPVPGSTEFVGTDRAAYPLVASYFSFQDDPTELVIEGVPVSFVVAGATLDADGLLLRYSGLRHLNTALASAGDPRLGSAAYSNDWLFSRGGSAGALRIPADGGGVSGVLNVNGGSRSTAWPQTQMTWPDFEVALIDGQLGAVELANVIAAMGQNPDCAGAGCRSGQLLTYLMNGNLLTGSRGSTHGAVTSLGTATNIGFGARGMSSGNPELSISRNDLPGGAPATLALPGYRFAADLPVVARLAGHLQPNGAELTIHDTRSGAFRDGNHAPPGLSLGPELYVDGDEPTVGTGQDLSADGRELRLKNGVDESAFPTTVAAKYVLRYSGMTGVFNVDPAALAAPANLYGYDATFSRFAFRFVDNRIDPYTWIDGEIRLEGDYADLQEGVGTPITFVGLEMDCSAQFGQGNLAFEVCDGLDNNASGVIDENCPAPLVAFDMRSRLQGLRFGGADGEPLAACSDGGGQLLLSQAIEPSAIDKPLSVELAWLPSGELPQGGHQRFRGLKSYQFEGSDEEEGFALRLNEAVVTVDMVDANRLGRISANGRLGLPFWESIDVDLRLENTMGLEGLQAATSLVTPSGVLLPKVSDPVEPVTLARSNVDVQADIHDRATRDSNRNADFQVDPDLGYPPALVNTGRYEWGSTGLGFRLPVYYRSAVGGAVLGARETPRFLGVERGFDKLGFSVKSGINFIEPDLTKVSFGASADFTALAELEIQVDLLSGKGLDKIDNTLLDLRIIRAPLFEPTFGGLSRRLNDFTSFANAGVDNLTRKALVAGVETLGRRSAEISPSGEDPIVTLSRGINLIDSVPNQLSGLLRSQLEAPVLSLFDQIEGAVRAQLLEIRMAAGSENDTLPASALADVRAVAADLDQLVSAMEHHHSQINDRLLAALELVQRIKDERARVAVALSRVKAILEQTVGVVEEVCMSDDAPIGVELVGYLEELFKGLDAAKKALAIASGVDALEPLIDLAIDDPVLATAIQDGKASLQRTARLLEEKLLEAELALKGALCTDDQAAQLLTNFETQYFNPVNAALGDPGTVADGLGEIDKVLQDLEALSNQVEQWLSGLGAIVDALKQVSPESTYNTLADAVVDAFNAVALEFEVLGGTVITAGQASLLARNTTEAGQVDVLDALLRPFEDLLDAQIAHVEQAARAELLGLLPAALTEPDELRALLVDLIMASGPIQNLREASNLHLAEVQRRLIELVHHISDQANRVVAGALAGVNDKIDGALQGATAAFDKIPLESAGLDGYAVITGTELERLHIGAEFTLKESTEGQGPTKFAGALDVTSWDANDKSAGCDVDPASSLIDVEISAFNLPAKVGKSKIIVKQVILGFALDRAPSPEASFPLKGVFGGISTQGKIAFSDFKIYDPGLYGGIGLLENYLGATAQAKFSSVTAEVAFLVGKTCDQEVLLRLDPSVARYIDLPGAGFVGVYVRGSAGFPVLEGGCFLNVSMSADVGAWVLGGPPVTVGGLVGGAAYGKVACFGALRGQIRAIGQVRTDGEMSFVGEGFGAAGAGFCSPETWTTLERSRQDGGCVTFDAHFSAGYQDKWKVFGVGVGGPH